MSFLFLRNSLVIREKEESKGYKETSTPKLKTTTTTKKTPIVRRVFFL